jgi:beta-N-acetylhexosaminidase
LSALPDSVELTSYALAFPPGLREDVLMLAAFITALAGTELTSVEAEALRALRPCGIILFARNVQEPKQVRRLTEAARACVGEDILVLIDQEGGRVRRLTPPHWRELPPAAAYGRLYAANMHQACDAAYLAARLTADDLLACGINTNCAPVLDVPVSGSHHIIGDRADAAEVDIVCRLGQSVAQGYMDGGVLPVIKHIPGHGRATKDSHLDLPVVTASRRELDASDFAAFRALADLPAAMTAHVVFEAVDPHRPASISPLVTREVIRGAIGFDGLLMSDDLGMKALSGSMADRARAVIDAGSDLALVCSGDLADTAAAADAVPRLEGRSLERFERVRAVLRQQRPFDMATAEIRLAQALSASA